MKNKSVLTWSKMTFGAVVAVLAMALNFGIIHAEQSKAASLVNKRVSEARASITEISAKQLKAMMDKKEKFTLIDVREKSEFDAGHIKGAQSIPRGILEWVLTGKFKDPNTPIVFYCKTGARSALSTKVATELGYKNLKNLRGSIKEWTEAGYEVYNQTGSFKLTPKGFRKRER
ncbi:hypothetical protein MNBD_NITROSPINAE04-371 [hydrothermal vent metagenome]|uniref:Rhodanese domain-containing protein n=1 Tax=hydrothermal vent metagenome TaxID=652676 RepID=A0A3B1CLX9_9ZZZZ